MWTRKSEDEIREYFDKEEAKARGLLRPLLFALIGTIAVVILYSLGYRGGGLRSGVILMGPSGFSWRTFGMGIFLFPVIFGIAVYFLRRRNPAQSTSDHLLCSDCKEPTHANLLGICECGGKLEPFAFYNWVEDRPTQ